MATFLLAILFIILLAKPILYVITKKRQRLPPGPPPFPVVGNLFQLGTKPVHEALTGLAATYGPIMTLKLGSISTIVISSSTLAKQVLIHNADHFSTPFSMDVVYAHHHNRLSVAWLPANSPSWRALRRVFGLIFTKPRLDASAGWRHLEVVNLVDRVRECSRVGLVVNVGQEALATLFETVLNTVFSRDIVSLLCRPKEILELIVAIIKEVGEPNLADCFPMLHSADLQGIRRRLTVLLGKLFKVFDDIIDMRLRTRARKRLEGDESCSSTEDALDVMLDAMEEQKGISREMVLHILLDIIGSGIDSSSKTVEWAMAELLKNPETLQKAQEELEKTVEKGKPVKESDICKLPYVQAVLKETFRLHPPVPFLTPRRTEDNIEFHGYTIPKGSKVLVNLWAIGRDPNDWALLPESFVPERFLDTNNNIDVKRRQEMIPFGAGRRICPGMALGSRTVLTVLATMINCFDWKLEDDGGGVDMQAEFRITLKKVKPVRAIPIDRVPLQSV